MNERNEEDDQGGDKHETEVQAEGFATKVDQEAGGIEKAQGDHPEDDESSRGDR